MRPRPHVERVADRGGRGHATVAEAVGRLHSVIAARFDHHAVAEFGYPNIDVQKAQAEWENPTLALKE